MPLISSLSLADKNGGPYNGKFGGLCAWVQNDAMIDLGYQGPDFTWSNGTVKERLDGFFCNGDWRLCFPEAKVIHLPKVRSDHYHVKVKLHPSIGNTRTDPPFRFQAMWMQHEEYAEFVTNSWKRPSLSFFGKNYFSCF